MKQIWEKFAKFLMPGLMALVLSYTGYGEYQKRQEPAVVTNNFTLPVPSPHPDVNGLISNAMTEHKRNYH